ncbi:MAG: quinone oxidoreductase [Jatrophihabitantaceae bacterium]
MNAANQTSALVVTRNGGSEVLELQSRTVADPAPGQLLIEVAAAGVNFIEVYQRQGIYPIPTPFVPCGEGAGTVRAVGDGVTSFQPGDRVAWAQGSASAAGLTLLPAEVAVSVPAGLDLELAGAAMLQGMTAHYLVNSTYPVQAGDPVLIHAAAGGVGQLLIQLAKAKGATVIGTASTEAKLAKARALGADHLINYSEVTDVAGAVRELTGGAGVAVVYDGVGKSTFEASLASLRPRGMLVLFGGASGQVPPFDLQRLNQAGSLFVTRPTMVHYLASRDELEWRAGDVLGMLAAGTLQLEIGGRYPLAEAARAYDDLEQRRSTGKLLLIP